VSAWPPASAAVRPTPRQTMHYRLDQFLIFQDFVLSPKRRLDEFLNQFLN
jgi:hypothetical protein